ncbi:nucleotidyltransferase family protein [Sphingomonas sanxanigenens]|uniref:Nucleotidyltransferase family protein n=1 Tax=Sphingomonas sanxanigenens DSM 19645 = NX02 TaxID=1123269 RepID=W0A816_9SPHN|nr:nucleotidyltransferase family protein [Sphingomonas sanxanigenens]AHE51810.1 hypothetical protein NX02_00205 [Sphingomonas sanxanigenens DSM 19645 = NX02]
MTPGGRTRPSRPTAADGHGGVLAAGRLADLVDAATGPHDAMAAWLRYRAALGDVVADEGERRLYALVAHRIDAARLPPADLALIRAQRRGARARHELLFDAAGQLADLFAGAGITPVFLKGIALQIRVFGDTVIRASSDIDIFVDRAALAPCLALIEAAGWTRKEDRPRTDDPDRIAAMRVKITYRMPGGVFVDIHWVAREPLEFDAALSAAFAGATVMRAYRGRQWLIPSDLWLLFETIEHGINWNEVVPIRWLVDALALLRLDDADIDFDRLCTLVEQARLERIFSIGLGEIARVGGKGEIVPPAVLDRLAGARRGSRGRLDLRARLTRPSPLVTIGASLSHYLLRHPAPPLLRLLGYPAYYRMRALRCMTWAEVIGRAVARIRPGTR